MLDPQDRGKFASTLTATMAVYGREISTAVIEIYWKALLQFDVDAVSAAFGAWICNPDEGKFPPKPGDLIGMIEGNTGDRARVAWSKVETAIRQVGPYQSIVFDDPIIHRAIEEMGGWLKLAYLPTNKDLEFAGLEFIKRYRAYALRGGVAEYPTHLIGEAEATNHASGQRVETPLVVVGDPERAALVAREGLNRPTLRIGHAPSVKALAAGSIGVGKVLPFQSTRGGDA